MYQSIEAVVTADGVVRLNEEVKLPFACRAIVTILPPQGMNEATLLSEAALAADWNRPEEDEAWAHLHPEM